MDSTIITVAIVPIVVPIVLAVMSRSGRGAGQKGALDYAPGIKAFGLSLALIFPVGISILMLLLPHKGPLRPDEYLPIVLLLLTFPALTSPLLLEFFRVRHEYDDAGLVFRSPWSRNRRIAWADVSQVKWRHMMKWLDLRTKDGAVIHLSPLLRGLGPFAEVALARVPPAAFDAFPEGRAALLVMSVGSAGDLIMAPQQPSQLLGTLANRRRVSG